MKKISLNIEFDADSADALIRSIDRMVEVLESVGANANEIRRTLHDIADILEGEDRSAGEI